MAFEVRVEADSVNPDGVRLSTIVATYPRIIHCELLTHRALSRNSSSSRAIPVERMIEAVERDPYIPGVWGSNQKGMQAGEPLDKVRSWLSRSRWQYALEDAVKHARRLADYGVHKQWVNRLLEPFSWITVVLSATDWKNFFALRCHPDAHPDLRNIAEMIRDAQAASKPREVPWGAWHLPFVPEEERSLPNVRLISAGRCARVSYLTHDGHRDPVADMALARRLLDARPMHASPFEHVATPGLRGSGNFRGWVQFRHEFSHESVRG